MEKVRVGLLTVVMSVLLAMTGIVTVQATEIRPDATLDIVTESAIDGMEKPVIEPTAVERHESWMEQNIDETKKLYLLLASMKAQDRLYLADEQIYEGYNGMSEVEIDIFRQELYDICQNAVTEDEKIRAAYQWIRSNPQYTQSVEYASRLDLSMRLLDIPSMVLRGYTMELIEDEEGEWQEQIQARDWNVIYTNGRWMFFDPTEDAVAEEEEPEYFGLNYRQIAKDHRVQAINVSGGGSFRVKGTTYTFAEDSMMQELLISGLPEDMGNKYKMPSNLADYPVRGFDYDRILDTEEWEQIEILKIKAGRESIDDFFCMGMSSLKKVVLPKSVKRIGQGAFADCTKLKTVIFSKKLESIGDEAFINCFALKSMTLPSGLQTIGEYAFSGSGLQSMTLPDTVTSLGQYAFYGCRSMKKLKLSDGMTTVSTGIAKYCTALEEVTLPKEAIYIGKEAFYNCSKLKKVVLPDQIQQLYSYAFANCYSLQSITFTSAISNLAGNVFHGTDNLVYLDIRSEQPPVITYSFYLPQGVEIRVPKGKQKSFEEAFAASYYVKKYKIAVQEMKP